MDSPLGISSAYINVNVYKFILCKFYAQGDIPLQALWSLDAFLSLSPYLSIYYLFIIIPLFIFSFNRSFVNRIVVIVTKSNKLVIPNSCQEIV